MVAFVPSFSRMGYYEPKDERRAQLNVRIPKALKDSLVKLALVWTAKKQADTGDAEAEVSTSDVAIRLMRVGAEGAWGELGLAGPPTSDDQLAAVIKVVSSKLKPSK